MSTIEKTYKTSEVAKIIGIHPNTVRMYEDLELISKPIRKDNGYRVFTDLHIYQFKLARKVFEVEVLQNGLRKKAIAIVKMLAKQDFDGSIVLTNEYIKSIKKEIANANEAVDIAGKLINGLNHEKEFNLKRKEVSELLGITMDTIRNWEMNGLVNVKRQENGYRIYTYKDIQRLKVIRSLKCGNYSLSAILRMLNKLSENNEADINEILNSPDENEDIISVCDKLINSLNLAVQNAEEILEMLYKMKRKYSNSPL
ncbi:MerR family transcriptional regulator [Paraclostridium sordellii]|uniref:MerR family transcriptional regulator n=1 Tax=Paraclostridium sordellii TaxID=1505 RepID=UPI0005E5CED8|nr:MerR family transcriptional regulator [Paeniclostridium sordellii]CEQ15136.1 MerR family transcriptional regulator [[Clostridium] sordellii] [Paeniclostridium sordellii]